MQQENVEVIRYIRPESRITDPFFGEKHDNMFGVTVIYDINYALNQVTAQWSVCNNDNFNKKVGIELARMATAITFNLDDVSKQGSLNKALAYVLMKHFSKLDKFYDGSFSSVIEIFNRATRVLKG